jgi:hypothetical protein
MRNGDGTNRALRENVTDHRSRLEDAVAMWPTPQARDHSGVDQKTVDRGNTRPLNEVAVMWRTPSTGDPKRGTALDWTPEAKAGEHSLVRQAALWATPTVNGNSNREGASSESGDGLRTQAVLRFSLPDRPISTVGEERSHIRRTLNPLFVEWLMGWPRAWTSLALTPPASTGFVYWETVSCHFRQPMLGALSQLALHEDQPAQQSLFG